MRPSHLFGLAAALVVSLTFALRTASADPRPFTFVYDTYPEGKGRLEYEQWVTVENGKPSEHGYNAVRLRHEFEYGVTENLDVSLYVADWRYERSKDFTGTRYEQSGVEVIYYLSNPATDAFGAALYAEADVGDRDAEFEGKLLLQKDFGRWTVAYNLILETEVEGLVRHDDGHTSVEGELAHALGVSYSVTPHLRMGGELLVESVYADWARYEGTQAFIGPNVSYTFNEHAWLAFTPLFQVTNREDEPKIQARFLFGYEF